MGITKEHIKVLECYREDDYSTEEIEEITGVPKARVRVYTKNILEYYEVDTLDVLKKLVRKDSEWIEKIKNRLEVSSTDRRDFILIKFLENDVVTLNELSKRVDVTRRTLVEDLKNVKKFLLDYDLKCLSLNSKGIVLEGKEEEKKRLFTIVLLKILLERRYLPKIFDDILNDFESTVIGEVQGRLIQKLLKKGVAEHTYILLQLDIIAYIGIVRNKRKINLWNLKYEIKHINSVCEKNKESTLFQNYFLEFEKVLDFIKYVNKNTNFYIKLSEEREYLGLIARIKLIEFKKKIELKEIYLLNRNFSKESKTFFRGLGEATEKYFQEEIDSFDKMSIFLLLKDSMFFKNLDIDEKNIIVYERLPLSVLDKILVELRIKKIKIDKFVSRYTLSGYLKNNNVRNILVFENISLNRYNINIIKKSLPLEEADFFKIKEILMKKK